MRKPRSWLLLAPVLAACVACTPRPQAPPPVPAPAPAPAPLPAPAPAPAPVPAPATEPEPPLADAERGPVLFAQWRADRDSEVEAFESFLVYAKVADVVPTYQLLRSASMWKECRAEPFDVPPPELWPEVREVLLLVRALRQQRVLPEFEVVSAYRAPRLNRCAGGAARSSHLRFAVDLAPLQRQDAERLCRFWREQGEEWDMGVSRYPSGRIHIDRNGFRTWGASHGRESSFCLR